jgi:hypothetical protein
LAEQAADQQLSALGVADQVGAQLSGQQRDQVQQFGLQAQSSRQADGLHPGRSDLLGDLDRAESGEEIGQTRDFPFKGSGSIILGNREESQGIYPVWGGSNPRVSILQVSRV